jgi:hypothetical protein
MFDFICKDIHFKSKIMNDYRTLGSSPLRPTQTSSTYELTLSLSSLSLCLLCWRVPKVNCETVGTVSNSRSHNRVNGVQPPDHLQPPLLLLHTHTLRAPSDCCCNMVTALSPSPFSSPTLNNKRC